MKIKENQKGITLIALVITIIVILIIAAISVATLFGENGLFAKTEEAKFKHKMSAIAEQWKMFINENMAESLGQVDIKQLYAGGDILYDIIADEEIEMDVGLIRKIRELLNEVGEEEEKYCIGFEGEFYYVSKNTIKNNKNQVKWCQEIGIKIWEYKEKANNKVVNGDYKLIKRSIYVYTTAKYWICERKNDIYKRRKWKFGTRKLDYQKSR